ncbi:MAG: catalase [Massilia sp.]
MNSSPASASSAHAVPPAQPGPAALVDALNNTFGRHPGKRASHARGFCTIAHFTPDIDAARFAASGLFCVDSASALVRFSVGGGNPNVSDKSRTVRGMGVRITAANESWDLVLISEPVFFAATPASFVSFLAARVADPATGKPDPSRIAAHNERYPDGATQPALLAAHAAPFSYARTAYFSNNAFVFRNSSGTRISARIVVEPLLGTRYLNGEEEASFADNFLEDELRCRLRCDPAAFEIYALLPAPGDSLIDPSQVWQGSEKRKLGTLYVTDMAGSDACDSLVFSPVNLPAAITPGDDPILAARHAAYGVSLLRRTAAAAGATLAGPAATVAA